MLVSLNVKNFAIIDNIEIDFHQGMSVLTGETGAGKSLIIDAIGLLFGKRAANDMIRYGEAKATIEGVFTDFSSEVKKLINQYGIEIDDELIIKREIFSNGKSTCRINNELITLAQLTEVSEYLGDIHSQSDTIGLINPKNYLQFLTNSDINRDLMTYAELLKAYREANKEYQELLAKSSEDKAKEDFLKYQVKELEQANLSLTEEEDLKKENDYLTNYEEIANNIKEFKDIYEDNEVLDNIYRSLTNLQKLIKYDQKFSEIQKQIEDCYYTLEEILQSPVLKMNNIDFDSSRLDEINLRLSLYSDLKRKYKKDTPELIAFCQQLKQELDLITNYDFYLAELKTKKEKAYIKALEVAQNIRAKRIKFSQEISGQIKKHLQDLQLKNVQFEIKFNDLGQVIELKDNGIDEVDFIVSFNKGEPLKPLAKIASGGEMSRFMLALKTVLGNQIPLAIKIFDEIDNGVSGAIAYSIAEKIKFIAKTAQVLCITHLPQVASIADHHYRISKVVENNRTFTEIKELNADEKIYEIASMISNGKPTDASLNLAQELISTTAKY